MKNIKKEYFNWYLNHPERWYKNFTKETISNIKEEIISDTELWKKFEKYNALKYTLEKFKNDKSGNFDHLILNMSNRILFILVEKGITTFDDI